MTNSGLGVMISRIWRSPKVNTFSSRSASSSSTAPSVLLISMSIRNSPSVTDEAHRPCSLPISLTIKRGINVKRKMTVVSRYMIMLMGRATNSDHRSADPAANVLGVISPKATITTVITNGASRTRAALP